MSAIEFGDCRDTMRRWAQQGVKAQTCVTSPPYFGLRDYGHPGQIGLEQTPGEYVAKMVDVFREVRRVLREDGTLWLNIGDSYASTAPGTRNAPQTKGSKTSPEQWGNFRPDLRDQGIKPKDLIGIPWMLAFALRADGWYLRQDIIWHKPNPMPESVRDRCTKAHEYLFLLSKSERYYFDSEAMKEPATTSERDIRRARVTGRGKQASSANYLGSPQRDKSGGFPQADTDNPVRNRRSVWTVATRPYRGAHFATYPPALIEPCILAGSRPGDVVLDPFMGSGTTAAVAAKHGRQYLGCELNPDYAQLQQQRIADATPVTN
jgi:DNA modification methylase